MKSWQTSHLPELQEYEIRGVLDLMSGWYQDCNFSFHDRCDWPVLWEYIDRNGLGGILGSAVLDGLCIIPEQFNTMAVHRYLSTQLHYEQAYKCVKALEESAARLEIPIRVLKGPALVRQGYIDTGTRSFSDIDVFTDSQASVKKLCEALQGSGFKSSEQHNVIERFGESECCSFYLGEWELEFRYPLDPPGEPMFEILLHHKEQLLAVPGPGDDILEPDPSLHLVFLIQHMAVHHLFSRFFWFLDLVVLVRQNRETIDFELVEQELIRLGLNNSAVVAGDFCRRYIDPDFPQICSPLRSWNYSMMRNFADPGNIASGRYGIYHRRLRHRLIAYLVGVVSFYLVADPVKGWHLGFGTNWTLNRFRNSFGFKKPVKWVDYILRPMIAMVLFPLAWLVSLSASGVKE